MAEEDEESAHVQNQSRRIQPPHLASDPTSFARSGVRQRAGGWIPNSILEVHQGRVPGMPQAEMIHSQSHVGKPALSPQATCSPKRGKLGKNDSKPGIPPGRAPRVPPLQTRTPAPCDSDYLTPRLQSETLSIPNSTKNSAT